MNSAFVRFASLALCLGLAHPAAAEDLNVSLDGCVRAAMDYSPGLKAARDNLNASKDQSKAMRAALLPHLGLDGNYTYIAQVLPAINLPPQMASSFGVDQLDFGYHDVYSVGLSAQWDIFGVFSNLSRMKVADRQRSQMRALLENRRRDLLLRVRLAYFQTQLAQTQVRLYADALRLAQSQRRDLGLRLKAGTSSRIDWLTASNEELDRRASYRLAQADLAGTLRDLFQLTGQHQHADVSVPVDGDDGAAPPLKVRHPTVAVRLDKIDALLAELGPAAAAPFEPQDVPNLRALWAQVAQARAQACEAFDGHLPTGSVGFRWSYDYPEEPLPQGVNQQTTTANFNLPLFSFGRVHDQVAAQESLAKAAGEQAGEAVTQARTDWLKSRDRLAGLEDQRRLQVSEAAQAKELRAMVYRSYKIGGSTFLEAQSAELQELQAGLALAETETQMLIELANLSALTEAAR